MCGEVWIVKASFGRNTRVFFLHFMEENTQTIFLKVIAHGVYQDVGVDDEGIVYLINKSKGGRDGI